jgi:hypothetical protein
MKSLKAVVVSAALGVSGAAFAAGGTISGSIAFTGTPPVAEPLKRNSDPICAKKQFNDESILVNGGKLQNVVVRLKGAPAAAKPPVEPVVIDQTDCMYRPRVQAAVEGQKVMVKNSDGTLHNVHSYLGTKTLFNQAQPPKAPPITKDVKDADVLKLKCDVHPWMTGYVVYSKSPHFAVSQQDGKYEIKNVPPGKYTVEAWHEKLGTQTAEVTVTEGKTAQADLAFAAK